MSMFDDGDEIPTPRGRADAGPVQDADEMMMPAFVIPDPESYSGWRYYHVKRQKQGQPARRRVGFR